MQFIENLQWRYATKKFDTTKKVTSENLDLIKEAIQLSASSYGLQAYKILEISDPALRSQLQPIAWNQSAVTDASHFFVFCNYLHVGDQEIDDIIKLKSSITRANPEKLQGYGTFVKGKMKEKSTEEMQCWTAKQAYIALTNAMSACAALRIDSLPMEGFENEGLNKALDLPAKGLNACVLLAIGYRHEEDLTQHNPKTRKPIADLFETI